MEGFPRSPRAWGTLTRSPSQLWNQDQDGLRAYRVPGSPPARSLQGHGHVQPGDWVRPAVHETSQFHGWFIWALQSSFGLCSKAFCVFIHCCCVWSRGERRMRLALWKLYVGLDFQCQA